MSALLQVATRAQSSYGPELVTNGDFASNITGWTAFQTPALSWDAGRLLLDPTADSDGVSTDISALTMGSTYRIQFNYAVEGWLSGNVLVPMVGIVPANSSVYIHIIAIDVALGSFFYSENFVAANAAGDVLTFQVGDIDPATTTLWLDNVSLREVL